jgi:hypothetical protein
VKNLDLTGYLVGQVAADLLLCRQAAMCTGG